MKLVTGILATLALLLTLAVTASFTSSLPASSPAHAFQGAQPPAKPTGLSVTTTAGSLEVSVEWDDVAGADRYWVRWRLHGQGQNLNAGVRPTSSSKQITVSGYGRWVVRVQACNAAGCSGAIAEGFTVEPPPLPAQPTGLEATTEPGSLAVSVDWDDVVGAASYIVRWRGSGHQGQLSEGVEVQSSEADITLSGYGEWVVRVEACNGGRCGPAVSHMLELTPAQPQNLTVSAGSSALNLAVSWDSVPGASSYRVEWRLPTGNFEATNQVTATTTSASITVAGYDRWWVRVRACGGAVCGPGAIHVVELTPGQPQNLTVDDGSNVLSLAVSWDAMPGAETYKLRWRRPRGPFKLDNELFVTTPGTDFTAADWGEWVVRVEGCNSAGCGPGVAKTVSLDAPQPNILLILTDDLGYGELGPFTTEEKIKTPRLDQMANEGMIFTSHYAGAPVCAPSRSVLMTGLHTGHTPIRGDKRGPGGNGDWPIEDDVVTLGEVMKDAGYRTALVGKWGLGIQGTTGHPNSQGFDHFFGYLGHVHAHYGFPRVLFRNGDRVDVNYAYADGLFIEEAKKYISEESDKPFFLVMQLTAPHANSSTATMEVPDLGQYADKSGWSLANKRFAAKVTLMDTHIGQILDELSEEGISQNTLTIFTSDNGPHNEGGKSTGFFDGNGQFRGIKRSLYEGGIRVPMIAHWPGTITANSSSTHISAFQDYMPTFAKLGGGETPTDTDGISMHQTLLASGTQPTHEHLYWEFYGQWGNVFRQAVRLGSQWKGVRETASSDTIELYNLENDIGETTNVAGDNPEIVRQIAALMQSERTASDVFFMKPGQSTGLSATMTAAGAVSLTWDAPSSGSRVTGYKILRRAMGSETELQVLVEDTGDTGTAYTDSSVTAGARYAYRVQALGFDGPGRISPPTQIVTPTN